MQSRLWTSLQASRIDRLSSALSPEAAAALMEEAGHALFQKALCLRRPYQKFLVLAGRGNNGGDALVLARLLVEASFPLRLIDVGEGTESPLRALQRERCEALGITLHRYPCDLRGDVSDPFLVDGLTGLGFRGPLRDGPVRRALLEAASLGARTVLAIDMPSGLSADDWSAAAPLPASHTLTFGAAKAVHLLAPACFSCGWVESVRLNFDAQAMADSLAEGPALIHSAQGLDGVWRDLSGSAHKYSRGHVLVIGGSPGKVGAVYLAAEAAMRSGAGWVSAMALSEERAPARPPFLTYEAPWSDDAAGLEDFIAERRVKAVLIGPGCMENPLGETHLSLLGRLNREHGLGLVFDAGALHGLGPRLEAIACVPERTLITPHPGEWLGFAPQLAPLDSLEAVEAAWQWCRKAGTAIFYKSARPFALSAAGSRPSLTCTRQGDARLAKAGSGDVLAGAALALLAAGVLAPEAAVRAQNMVATAAKRASHAHGFHGLTPLDIVRNLGTESSF